MRLLLFDFAGLSCLGAPTRVRVLSAFCRADSAASSCRETLLFLIEPRTVVALPRNAAAAIEFENPLGGVVEEVAVVRHGDDGARKALQKLFEPLDAFRVEMVRRLVQQQHVGLRQQQTAQRDAALLAAGKRTDLRIPRRQTQRVGGNFELLIEIVAGGGDDGFELRLLFGELVEVGVGIAVRGVDFVERLRASINSPRPSSTVSRTVFSGSSFGSCSRIADRKVRHRFRLAVELRVDAGHDAQQRRLPAIR